MSEVLVTFGGYPSARSGAERMAWRTSAQLARRGHAVTVLTDSRPPADGDAGAIRIVQCDDQLGATWRPDVVHAYDLAKPEYVDLALGVARRTGARFALTPATAPELWPDAALGRAACRRAHIIYVLTSAEARVLFPLGATPDRVRQIPHAPDLRGEPDPAAFRRRLGLRGPTVVFIGRRIPSKGYAELLRAARLVWRELPDTEFLFIGPNDETAAKVFRAHTDPRIIDLGVVDEQTKHDALAAGAVLCLPSSADVFPLVFVEAWVCGKPVVTGDFAGADSVVEHGVDGLVIAPRPAEIAAALVQLLSDDAVRRAMGRAGQSRVRREFTWDKVAASVAAGYACPMETLGTETSSMTRPTVAPEWRVTLADNTIDHEEIEAVTEVLRSRWLSPGQQTRAFEQEFAEALGCADAVAVSSGTAALHLALRALGIGPGDEVILPSLSFVSAAAMVVLQGGTPVFADVRSDVDPTVDPVDVRGLITGRTRAIVAMHYGGYAADLPALVAIARTCGIALIEDAAHAPVVGAAGAMLGAVGDIGCFSFFATKNLTTGEGGMVVAKDSAVLDQVRAARAHCLTASTWDRLHSGAADYDVRAVGLNYRPTEISSAIGRVQLRKLAQDRRCRRELTAGYRARLAAVPGVVVPFADRTDDSALHLMPVLLPTGIDRDKVRTALRDSGIQTSVHYPPTHRFSFYRDNVDSARRPLPITDDIAGRLLSLPLHARMTDADVALVVDRLFDTVIGLSRESVP
ncbi:aminotransferase class I/II-fold pyridoxal phosphate-dependent enzyme [Nocardia sp. NPDC057030]|uniref:aminotransferase class I/II-fold pyridoxal phosphate-dependent enzyme n=1 Tax=unclassified Nocardia TaxID=2637762 RepID=UPI00363603D5